MNSKVEMSHIKEQQNSLPEIKKEFPWFGSVYSLVLQDTLHRVDKAFTNFYRRCKDNSIKEKGFPRFKKRGQYNSITYSQYHKYPTVGNRLDCSKPNSFIKVPKIGEIKIRYHRNIPADEHIKTMTISKEADKWFVCFSVEVDDVKTFHETSLPTESKRDNIKSVGIDVGLIDFIYTSDNKNVSAPRLLRLSENNLKRLQRKLSNLKKGDLEYLKLLKALKKAHFRVKSKRLGFIMDKASELIKSYDIIVHEKLNIKNLVKRPKPRVSEKLEAVTEPCRSMKSETKENETSSPLTYLPNGASAKSGLNKSINDAGWGLFFNALEWLAKKAGKTVISINPQYTSQECSSCGVLVKKSLSTRTHLCECGFIANRDHNASINILRLGLQSLGYNP